MKTETTHQGHTIALTGDFKFLVSGPLFDEDKYTSARTYESAAEAKSHIDKRILTAEKQKRAEATVKLPVIASNGRRVNIKGIHARLGNVITDPATDADHDLYVEAEWVFDAVKEKDRLTEELVVVEERLQKVQIRTARYYSSGTSPEGYQNAIDALVEEYKQKQAAAVKDIADKVNA